MIFAVGTSQISDKAMKSPNDDILSAPRALAYAVASGDSWSFKSSTMQSFASSAVNSTPTAAPNNANSSGVKRCGTFNTQ